MDVRRGQLCRDAVASSSGRHVGQRPCPVGVRSRPARLALCSQRLIVGQRDPHSMGLSVACRAMPGSSPPPSAAPAAAQAAPHGAPHSAAAAAAAQPYHHHHDDAPMLRSAQRVRRLNTLVETRRLYRNCIRAEYLLNLERPLYTPPPPPPPEQPEEVVNTGSSSSDEESERNSGSSGSGGSAPRGPSPEEDKALKAALDAVAEMALVSEQLKASLRFLPTGFGGAIFPAAGAAASEEAVREVARQHVTGLRERLAAELPPLPITSDAAVHYIDSRNSKYSRRVALDELQGGGGGGSGGGSASADLSGSSGRASALERLEAAERAAGEIIANSIKPALKKASEQDIMEVVRGTGTYLRGLWVRLNGGSPAGSLAALAGLDLPLPVGSQEQSELAISQLGLDLEALEKKLQEASKHRENKLRKAGLQGRVQMAIQLKGLDAEVLLLSSRLAVSTLQLEMEHVYGSLEAEALDVFNGVKAGGLLARDGSTNELALLVAEFALLDEQLTLLAAALEGGPGEGLAGPSSPSSSSSHSSTAAPAMPPATRGPAVPPGSAAAAAAAMGPAILSDDVLSKLAAEIPDMRSRVGVADQTVFGSQGFSLTRARLQIRESLDKVKEAVTFLSRGFKLLGSDVATSSRLFVKAALGNTLKPREVSALRRTARDLLTFIPFTIILIIPLSPLGHVLVFGFIQRYFPSFFPSQFSSRRQEIMVRYEELERQLLEAQATAEAAEEEVELARAREAVARLTAPEPSTGAAVAAALASMEVAAGAGLPPSQGGDGGGPAAGAAGEPGGGNGNGGGGSGAQPPSAALSSVDEVTLQEATQKVRILAEQLDEIRNDVNMGEAAEASGNGGPLSQPNGNGGGGGGGAASYSGVRRH